MTDQIISALSVCEPWAWAVTTFKPIENRTWQTTFRGRIAIHASKSVHALEDYRVGEFLLDLHPNIEAAINSPQFDLGESDAPADLDLDSVPQLFKFGAIIGSVEVVDCVDIDRLPATDAAITAAFAPYTHTHAAPELGFLPWAEGPICWVLAHPRRYRRPIACNGKLNLWRLTPELAAAVAAAELDLLTDPGEPAERPTPPGLLPGRVSPAPQEPAAAAAASNRSTAAGRRKRAALAGQQLPARKVKR